jgi:hypothetical protein
MPLIKTSIDSIKYSRYIIHINTAHGEAIAPLAPPPSLATPLPQAVQPGKNVIQITYCIMLYRLYIFSILIKKKNKKS